MTTNQKSPATKRFCVWADDVRRVYQHVEAENATQAHHIAMNQPECWKACDLHESNGYQVSGEVLDLQSDEFVLADGSAPDGAPLPWRMALSECEGVYGGKQHWAIFGPDAAGVIADVEGSLDAQSKENAEFIVRACNNHEELLTACKMSLHDAKDALSGDWEPARSGWESIVEHLTRVIGKAEETIPRCRTRSRKKTGKRGRRRSPVASPSPMLRGVPCR